MYQYQEPEATQWDYDSEAYGATAADARAMALDEDWDAVHFPHDQDGLYRCCGLTDEDRAADAARMAAEEAEEAAYAARVAAGDLPW